MSGRRLIGWLTALGLIGATVGATAVYFGWYNVAATEQHTAPVYWLLHTSLKRSAAQRAEEITVPPLDGAERIERGLVLYREHCLSCHGAPGVPPHAFALGMTPLPANLAHTAKVWSARDMYWVVRYGIKMTGMPAWEFRLRDDELWDIVAFLQQLPTLSPADYTSRVRQIDARRGPLRTEQTQARKDAIQSGPIAGDPRRGETALQQYACVTCHEIPGVVGANYPVGPPLDGIAKRNLLAGRLPNTRENMVRWLRDPPAVKPGTAMPNVGVTEADAHHLAAFLETLQ